MLLSTVLQDDIQWYHSYDIGRDKWSPVILFMYTWAEISSSTFQISMKLGINLSLENRAMKNYAVQFTAVNPFYCK